MRNAPLDGDITSHDVLPFMVGLLLFDSLSQILIVDDVIPLENASCTVLADPQLSTNIVNNNWTFLSIWNLEACLKRNQLKFTYYSPARDEKSKRTVDPYHLFNYMGTWHLIAYCHLRKSVRDFALGRITETAILQETFERPSDFSVKDFFQSSFGIYKGKSTKEVTLRFSPLKSRWIRDQVWHRDQKTKVLEDGSLELTFPVADFSEIKMEILKHGDMVEVIRPKSLRELTKAEAKSIADIY